MSKTTKELKDAVEARIDREQRRLVLQILSNDDTLDEQTTAKLQQLMHEIELREQKAASPAPQAEPVDLAQPMPAPERAAMKMMPDELAAKAPLPPKEAPHSHTAEPETAAGFSRENELAELERKNAEMSQLLEQLTREKQNTLINHLSKDPDMRADDFPYQAHQVTARFNKDEPGWFRIYLPILVLVILIGLAAWAFFTFIPIQPTL